MNTLIVINEISAHTVVITECLLSKVSPQKPSSGRKYMGENLEIDMEYYNCQHVCIIMQGWDEWRV